MNELDGIIKFLQSPLGRMLTNAGKDVLMNHVIPYARSNMSGTVKMTPDEQARRAQEEFVDVSGEFDIPGETEPQAEEPPAPETRNKKPPKPEV